MVAYTSLRQFVLLFILICHVSVFICFNVAHIPIANLLPLYRERRQGIIVNVPVHLLLLLKFTRLSYDKVEDMAQQQQVSIISW